MRLSPHPYIRLSSVILLVPSLATAISLDCSDVRDDGVSFNFRTLEGPHSLYRIEKQPNGIKTTTFTIDICRPLEKQKGVPKEEDCPNYSRACAIKRLDNTVENVTTIIETIPIAGEFSHSFGGALDPKWTRLKSSASNADKVKEGVRLEMNGGKDTDGQKQKAIVEFLCNNSTRDGMRRDLRVAEDEEDDGAGEGGDKKGEEVDDEHGGKLKLVSWDVEEGTKVFRLDWTTKYGCEDVRDDRKGSSSGHWGFFTWFIIIAFMGVAAYLIFGSWLNYNKYSARGWDLLPHSETIRDVPYLFRDWMRRVVNTIQGGGSRGGYSAV
ncbi:hypothetical protein HO173_008831 [Letharia columbiana]|uniref:Autophagy-related protein 27 n=1 Tax=Letharia columbiana TaxID=112416 RepID=A0A8H6L2B0_9LECA|nr:uncharacterized protein HO173_008831 [Letharia columbiana]KAF6232868.1 hypothetical protein HO173_008831 [Letharia columbiana]